MQNIRLEICFKAILLLLVLDKIIYDLQLLKTFWYILYSYWKSTKYEVNYKNFQ